MQNIAKNIFLLKIPSILAALLEAPEDQVTVQESSHEVRHDLVLNIGDRIFLADFKNSSARPQLLSALMDIEKNRNNLAHNTIPIMVVPYMAEAGRHFCSEHRLPWLDLSGNAHIRAPGLLIHVEGRPNRFRSAGRPRNPFASKSSRVARQLLIEPDRYITQRELSKVLLLGEGFVSSIVRKLEMDGMIVRNDNGALRPSNPDHLLDAWHEVYDFNRHHIIKGHVAARSGDALLRRIADSLTENAVDYAATGLGAAWIYCHFANFRLATFYLRHPPSEKVLGWLNFREDERGANTWLVIANDEGVFYGSEVHDGIPCVHPVQVYLDLKDHPERASEAAAKLRQDYFRWRQDG
jgi:hypothetical protein